MGNAFTDQGYINTLAVYNGELVAAGSFWNGPGANVAAWDGSSWHALGSGMPDIVHDSTVYEDGLIIGGPHQFQVGSLVTRWDGTSWQTLGGGMDSTVFALTVHDGALVAGGAFTVAHKTGVNSVAKWIFCLNCPGDIAPFNGGDAQVNVADLLTVVYTWGPCGVDCPADIAPPGGDGQVNVSDLMVVIQGWGACPS